MKKEGREGGREEEKEERKKKTEKGQLVKGGFDHEEARQGDHFRVGVTPMELFCIVTVVMVTKLHSCQNSENCAQYEEIVLYVN